MKIIRARTKVFENSFFPYCIKEWLKLGDKIRSIESSKQFKKTVFDFIRPKENSMKRKLYVQNVLRALHVSFKFYVLFNPVLSMSFYFVYSIFREYL